MGEIIHLDTAEVKKQLGEMHGPNVTLRNRFNYYKTMTKRIFCLPCRNRH